MSRTIAEIAADLRRIDDPGSCSWMTYEDAKIRLYDDLLDCHDQPLRQHIEDRLIRRA